MIRALAWFNGVYGILFILFLNSVPWTFPGVSRDVTPVPIFGEPTFSVVALIGLLVFEENPQSVWYLFIMNLFVLLGIQLRGEWLAFGVALLLWSWLTKRLKKLALVGCYLAILFAFVFALNLKIEAPQGRGGGTVSARSIVGRVLAPINPDLASDYSANYEMAEGTALWRVVWWAQIWLSVNAVPSRPRCVCEDAAQRLPLCPRLHWMAWRNPLFRVSSGDCETALESLEAHWPALRLAILVGAAELCTV
jgi:hypothetical protein